MSSKIAQFKDLQDKSVFITGGGSGIGAAITEGFISQRSRVTFVQRSEASEFCDVIEQNYGIRPDHLKCDISDTKALKRSIDKASEKQGDIAILINNAADDVRHSTLDLTEENWDKSQSITLKPYFFSIQFVLDGMIKLGGGSIINMSSISYMMGNSGYPSYVAANSAINGLTRGIAREFGHKKIRVNTIAPGWVMTKKQQMMWVTPKALEEHLKRQCLKELLVADDIVSSVLFLSSNASKAITGQLLAVDGGVVTTG